MHVFKFEMQKEIYQLFFDFERKLVSLQYFKRPKWYLLPKPLVVINYYKAYSFALKIFQKDTKYKFIRIEEYK